MAISVTGDFDEEEMRVLLEESFSNMPTGTKLPTPKMRRTARYTTLERSEKTDYTDITFSFAGTGFNREADLLKYLLLSQILNQRVMQNLRHRETQLVYHANFYNVFGTDSDGAFNLNTSTKTEDLELVIQKSLETIKELIAGITDEEFEDAIKSIELSKKSNHYNPYSQNSEDAFALLKLGKNTSPRSFQEVLKTITKQDIIEIAHGILTSSLGFSAYGVAENTPSMDRINQIQHNVISDINLNDDIERANKTTPEPKWLPIPDNKIILGELKKTVLPNGFTVITEYRPNRLTSCFCLVRTGLQNEIEEQNGIAHLLEHMICHDLPKDLHNARTSASGTTYEYANLPQNDVPGAIKSLRDGVFSPTLQEATLNGGVTRDGSLKKQGEKEVVLREMSHNKEKTADGYEILSRALFGKTIISRPLSGNKETVSAISAENLRAFHNKWYVPNNSTLVLAGDMKHEEAVTLCEEAFGDLPKKEITEISDWTYKGNDVVTNLLNDEKTASSSLIFPTCHARDKKSYSYEVLAEIIKSKLTSQLKKDPNFFNIFQEIQTSINNENSGFISIYSSGNIGRSLERQRLVLSALRKITISERDVRSKTKVLKIVNTLRRLDNHTNGSFLIAQIQTEKKELSVEEYRAALDEITLEDVNALFQEMLQQKPVSVIFDNIEPEASPEKPRPSAKTRPHKASAKAPINN